MHFLQLSTHTSQIKLKGELKVKLNFKKCGQMKISNLKSLMFKYSRFCWDIKSKVTCQFQVSIKPIPNSQRFLVDFNGIYTKE
jgi:hypothetical protein